MRRPHKRARIRGDTHYAQDDSFFHALSTLRDDGVCCDITLVAGEDGKQVKGHRIVLAARSPWFEAMARRWSKNEGSSGDVCISEVQTLPCEFFWCSDGPCNR